MSDSTRWDTVAERYDGQAGHGLRRPAEGEVWRQLFEPLFPPGQPLRILDVGTGTGFVAFLLARAGHEVTGVDFSARMLAVAQEKAAALGAPPVRFVLGDAASPELASLPGLGVPEGGFDAVVSRHVIWTLPDPAGTIGDWARLTRSGGRIVAVDGIWSTIGPIDRLAELAGSWLEAARTRRRPFRQQGDPRLPLRHIHDPVPARDAFTQAGLTRVRSELVPDIDRAERASMTFTERLQYRWRRYLVEGTVSRAGPLTGEE